MKQGKQRKAKIKSNHSKTATDKESRQKESSVFDHLQQAQINHIFCFMHTYFRIQCYIYRKWISQLYNVEQGFCVFFLKWFQKGKNSKYLVLSIS